jgi:hypothetical protein
VQSLVDSSLHSFNYCTQTCTLCDSCSSFSHLLQAIPPHPNSRDIPIPIENALRTGHQANLETLLEARLSANRMLNKMKHVIQNPASPRHSAIIQASFGPRHDNQQISQTIQRMRQVNMRTRVHPLVHPLVPSPSPADTRFMVHPVNHALVADSVVLRPSFFGLTPAAGGETLIPEAARYTRSAGVHAECDMNHNLLQLTQDSQNMHHQCADAYSVFANLCDQAIHRRDVHILKRALLEGDKQASPRSDAASCPPQRIKKNTVPNTS